MTGEDSCRVFGCVARHVGDALRTIYTMTITSRTTQLQANKSTLRRAKIKLMYVRSYSDVRYYVRFLLRVDIHIPPSVRQSVRHTVMPKWLKKYRLNSFTI